MTAREITQDEARKLYDEGYPIAVTFGDRTYSKWWQSAATRHGQSFDEAATPLLLSQADAPRRYWRRVGKPTVAWDAPGFIRRREDFAISSLSGDHNPTERGELPPRWWETLLATLRGADWVYVVYSFGTPIAWEWSSDELDESGVVIPPVRYSMTTTQHQTLAATALRVPMPALAERSKANAENPRSPYGSGGISLATSTRGGA